MDLVFESVTKWKSFQLEMTEKLSSTLVFLNLKQWFFKKSSSSTFQDIFQLIPKTLGVTRGGGLRTTPIEIIRENPPPGNKTLKLTV
jgi:hypothetical protein